ncbi:MAG: NUDIX domain-containing protein [Caldilineaceae bacterium]
MQILAHSVNRYGGVDVEPAALPTAVEQFEEQLDQSLAHWHQDDLKLVWLEIPINRVEFIPLAVKRGFIFHHSTAEQSTLVYRLQPDAFIPAYASHYVGVGGVVLNEKQELLVVAEQYHRSTNPRFYKLPGGLVDPNEHLANAVVREIWEETGIRAEFEALICFRHWHGARFGKSDIYFICRLRPRSHEITRHEGEIAECLWMPVQEYLAMESVSAFNKAIVRAAMGSKGISTTWIDGHGTPITHEFYMPELAEPEA